MKLINNYIDAVFQPQDEILENVLLSIKNYGMQPLSVSPSEGKLLTMLVSINGTKKALEIGSLGGYSGICIARGLVKEGKLTSLETEESYANLAYQNVTNAGFGEQITYMSGPVLDNLEKLIREKKHFDFFFFDAEKENYEIYLEKCIQLANPGSLIVADNVLADESVIDPSTEPKHYTEKMKKFNEVVANHPQLESILIPIGDGLTLSKVIK
nr:O-methyltransferase [Lysinibacillus timonensis]